MKRTNRQKNSIIIGFIFSIIIFSISIYYIIYYLYPSMSELKAKKVKIIKNQGSIEKISKNGLKYVEFKKMTNNLKIDNKEIKKVSYLKKIIKEVDKDFYKNNFINNSTGSYEDFLKNKDIELSKMFKKRSNGLENNIQDILPTYSDTYLLSSNSEGLNNFNFINYLENLFNFFNLEYNGSLGISNVESYYEGIGDLETSVFFIPLDFNLKGEKKDIINFIHFFENVGNVKILGNTLLLHKDNFIDNNIGQKLLSLGNKKDNFNIYNNQLADISYIKIPEYLDSSFIPSIDNEINFAKFIKDDVDQNTEEITINIGLKFYTKGIENYRIIEDINFILNNFKGLLLAVSSKIKEEESLKSRDSKKILFLNKLKSLNKTLNSLKGNIPSIKKRLKKKESLTKIYKDIIKYDKIIDKSSVVMGEVVYKKEKKLNIQSNN